MGEEWMALEGLDDGDNSIVAANPEVVALGDVVGHDNSGPLADSGEDGQENSAFERLGFIDDDEGIVQRTTADMGQR